MIADTLQLLREKDWMIEDIDINIAKGLYELPSSIKELKTSYKRKKLTNGNR